jgi:hypothetical protein
MNKLYDMLLKIKLENKWGIKYIWKLLIFLVVLV